MPDDRVRARIEEIGEAIDHAALDPTHWQHVVDTIQRVVPGTKVALHVDGTHAKGAIGILGGWA
jgi:hypothetical protein